MGPKFGQIRPVTEELADLERLKNPNRLIMGEFVVTTLVLFYNRSYSFLQIKRSPIKAWMSLNSVKIPSPIMELAALEYLKH